MKSAVVDHIGYQGKHVVAEVGNCHPGEPQRQVGVPLYLGEQQCWEDNRQVVFHWIELMGDNYAHSYWEEVVQGDLRVLDNFQKSMAGTDWAEVGGLRLCYLASHTHILWLMVGILLVDIPKMQESLDYR